MAAHTRALLSVQAVSGKIVMMSVVRKAERFHGKWIFLKKMDNMKKPIGTSLIDHKRLYPTLSYAFFFFPMKCH